MPSLWIWVHSFAAASSVVVVALALSTKSHAFFRLPLVALAVDEFAWNAASIGRELTGDENYNWAGAVVTPVFTAILLHYALVFTGKLRRHRKVLVAAYSLYLAEALLVVVDWRTHVLGASLGLHAVIAAVTSLPIALFGARLLLRHFQVIANEVERERTWLFVAVLVVAVPLMLTDLFNDMGFGVPPLATVGSCVLNGILITITLGLFETSPRQQLGQAALLALVVVVGYLTLFGALRENVGLFVFAASAFSLALVAAGRLGWQWFLRRQEGVTRFATVGRFSAQMAHDLKNPLAAAKGAAEYLQGELKTLEQPHLNQFGELLVQQLDRLASIIDRYHRLSHLELALVNADLNEVVKRVLALQQRAAPESVVVKLQLAESVPRVSIDSELFSSALENLVKNAFEAMPKGGTVTVSTRSDEGTVLVGVEDTGEGMDPRTKEQAFSLFFTTKAQGSGLGLAFVQQLMRAHGGEVRLTSQEGRGTTVTLVLPEVDGLSHP